jgi:lambda family phage portal protein
MAGRRTRSAVVPVTPNAQGAFEGAERLSRETARWMPSMRSPDAAINPVKPLADARGADMVRNDGHVQGAIALYRDGIVGSRYRLNAQPAFRTLQQYNPAFDDVWAEEYQEAVEETFNLAAESAACWFDASRRNTLTGLVRLAIATWGYTGEVLGTAMWIREVDRPFSTAVMLIDPMRLSNKDGVADTMRLRRGVLRDRYGRPVAYQFRDAHPGEIVAAAEQWTWTEIPAQKPWGRKQVLHITETSAIDQTRGVSDMVASLKEMRMTKTFKDMVLQNAVINAMVVASVESELPNELIVAMMGGSSTTDPVSGMNTGIAGYLAGLQAYLSGSNNVQIDGAKIPHLYPGTKLNIRTPGDPGGIGTDFEASLLRHIAAALGVSYEELSRDYSKTTYSGARAAFSQTQKAMNARKKFIADRLADDIYSLWLEEVFDQGWIPLPRGVSKEAFYLPLAKDAFTQCSWIGSGRGQIDELKETQAALLRISGGLSTREAEISQLGGDYRQVFRQLAREQRFAQDLDLRLSTDVQRPGQQMAGNTMRDSGDNGEDQDR